MAISDTDLKLLWGRAAGFCSRPGCQTDLTKVNAGENYNIGEMAHVIAQSPKGPRGNGTGGSDTYDNLVLLCPTCHRDVDKAPPGKFPEETLRAWKRDHEEHVRQIGSENKYSTAEELAQAINMLLSENHALWKELGPKSKIAEANPSSNAHRIWEMRRQDRIVPNNRRIINTIRANSKLLTPQQSEAFSEFTVHAEAFEEHVYDRLDDYPLFPQSFSKAFAQ